MVAELFIMEKIGNLLIVAGRGTKSGKTYVICRILEQFRGTAITAIKITPHFHETTAGLITENEGPGYHIYSETDSSGHKDTCRMLRAGAAKVYYAQVWDSQLSEVFTRIMALIPPGTPVICESPALREIAEPGVFIIMTSESIVKSKDIKSLQELPHLLLRLDEIDKMDRLPIGLINSNWHYI